MPSAAYMRQWRADNPERYEEQLRRKQEKILSMTREERNELREYNRLAMAKTRALAAARRRDLRSLMDEAPGIYKDIRKSIDIWSASDGEVNRFYRQFERKLNYAEYEKRNRQSRR